MQDLELGFTANNSLSEEKGLGMPASLMTVWKEVDVGLKMQWIQEIIGKNHSAGADSSGTKIRGVNRWVW